MCAALVVAAFPWVIGWDLTPPGWEYFANSALNAWDPGVYYSYIEQGRQGSPLMADVMTSEPYAATLYQPFWWLLGRAAELFQLSNPVVYFLARLALVPVFIAALWWAVRWLLADWLEQRIAAVLALFGAGLGGWLSFFHQDFSFILYADLWVSEALPVLNLWSSTHFLLVTSGIIVTLVAVERAWRERSWRLTLIGGLAALVTLFQHPFHLITWLVLWVIMTMVYAFRTSRMPWRYVQTWGTVLAIASPAIILHGLQLWLDPLVIDRAFQNVNRTWPWFKTLALLGAFAPLAVFGAWRRRHQGRIIWAAALAIVYVLVIYAPVDFQRRLSQGMFLPFAWLSASALAIGWRKLPANWTRWLAAAVFLIFISGSWLRVGWEIIGGFAYEVTVEPLRGTYVSPDERGVVDWFKQHQQPNQTVLSSFTTSRIVVGLAGQRVYIAHNVETVNFVRKESELRGFYQSWSPNEQREWLEQTGVCFVINGPREQGYGSAFQPSQVPELQLVWRGESMQLYQSQSCQ